MKKVMKKLKLILLAVSQFVITCLIFLNNVYASGVSEGSISTGVNSAIDGVFNLIALIFAGLAGFNFILAILAYGEAKSDGGSGQASGKLAAHATTGIVMAAGAVMVIAVFKPAITSMMGL